MISTMFRDFFNEDKNDLLDFEHQNDDFFGDEKIDFDSDDFFKDMSDENDKNEKEKESKDQEERKPYVYQYESVSQRINDIGMKKERVYDSKKGSQFMTKRKKGNKVMKVLKKKNKDGKEEVKKTFENVKDEKEFENQWDFNEVKEIKMKDLNNWKDIDIKMLM